MAKKRYAPPSIEVEDKSKGDNAHLRLPFGLCKKYGIHLPNGATPRDAWNALKGIGIVPEEEYDKFYDDKNNGENARDTSDSGKSISADEVLSTSRMYYDGTFTKEYVKKQLEAGTAEYQELVKTVMRDSGITYEHGNSDYCRSAYGEVVLTVDENYGNKNSSYSLGEMFYHETFHAIDGLYSRRFGAMLSSTYTNDQGETLYDVLRSEKRKFGSKGIAAVRARLEADVDKYLVENGISTAAEIENTQALWQEQQARLNMQSSWDARQAVIDSSEFKSAKMKNSLLEGQRLVYKRYLYKQYSFISDILSQWNESVGMGHSMSYWKQNKYNACCEFFAEVGACTATNKEALDLVREYFPKSVKFAEEIIDGVKSGRIKR
jgi:hypothetical protein